MKDGSAFGGGELIVAHRSVSGPEIERLVLDTLDATTRADALVVDLHTCDTGVGAEPLLVQRGGERGAGAGECLGFIWRRSRNARGRGGRSSRRACRRDRARRG